jgi:pyruvate dehydrogenase E2 component (dihydrolipoamide acetyltransferase)
MIEEIKLPEISENVESGEVVEILVKIGDFIEAEEPVIELETEKATFDVPAPFKGKVVEINVKQGEQVKVGQTLIKVDTQAQPVQEKQIPVEITTPEKIETISETKLTEPPQEKESPIEAETKAPDIQTEQSESIEKKPQLLKTTQSVAPSVRQLADELGIDINTVTGSGPDGRISADDVKKTAKNLILDVQIPEYKVQHKPLPDFSKWGQIERQQLTTTRKRITDTLSYSWSNVPQVTQYDKADITILEEFRCQYLPQVEKAGGKLTITSILLKIVASAMNEFPIFNSSLDTDSNEIIYKKYFNISVAVDTDRGLLVPVIHDVNKKSILELSVELTQLAEKTRQHKVSPDDMVGGNFTISNLGGIGGTNFAPIIYWPQAAILGVARADYQPVFHNESIKYRLFLPLSLSYDHRIIDGAQGVRFLRCVVDNLERPFNIIMQESPE